MAPAVARSGEDLSILVIVVFGLLCVFYFLFQDACVRFSTHMATWFHNRTMHVSNRWSRLIYPVWVLFSSKQKMDASNAESLAAARTSTGEIIIVLHGVCANYYNTMFPLVSWLKKAGHNVVSIGFDYRGGHKAAARQVKEQIDSIVSSPGIRHITLVGLSFGGVVARYYIEVLGGKNVVNKLITVFTPLKDPSPDNTLAATILLRLFFRRDADLWPTSEDRMDGLFSVPHVIMYGTSDVIMGKLAVPESALPEYVKTVTIPYGHAFVSFNGAVLKQIDEHIKSY